MEKNSKQLLVALIAFAILMVIPIIPIEMTRKKMNEYHKEQNEILKSAVIYCADKTDTVQYNEFLKQIENDVDR